MLISVFQPAFAWDVKTTTELQTRMNEVGFRILNANRSIWVYPLYQAGNITFYIAGFVFVPIHGGRVKLLTKESFTVYFEAQ